MYPSDPQVPEARHEGFGCRNRKRYPWFTVLQGNIIDDKAIQDAVGYECYDLVVANILAPVIIMLQGEVARHMKPGTVFITSGIIDMKEEAVKEAFAANPEFELVEITHQGEWVSITARKKA